MADNIFFKLKELKNLPNDAGEKLSLEERLNKLMEIKVFFDEFENPLYDRYTNKINNEEDSEIKKQFIDVFKYKFLDKDIKIGQLYDVLIDSVFKYYLYVPYYMDIGKDIIHFSKYHCFCEDFIIHAANEDLNLLESLTLLTIALRLDYWDYYCSTNYLIANKTINKLLNLIYDNLDKDQIKTAEDYFNEKVK